jgi:CheY-like chemotaxis protein
MWRRYGDALYTLVTFAIFGFETLALGALSISFLLGKAAGIASTPVEEILFAVVTSTASALALLGLYLLTYHFTSAMRDRWQAERLDTWTEKWIGLALETDPAGGSGDVTFTNRLSQPAIEAVLSLLEAVKGEEGDRLKEALIDHHVDRAFLRRLQTGHLAARLDAIERLGKARLPVAVEPLLELVGHPKPVVRRMAVRAAAGTLATMTPEAELDEGSTFWVELPLTEGPVQRAERQEQDGAPHEQDHHDEPALTVLYIEDNLSNLQLVERILGRRPGVRLISAMRPELGLDLASEHHPDLMLLDLHLPDMPGQEVLRRLLANPRTAEIPVVVLSADARPSLIKDLVDQGAKAFMTKPLDVNELLLLLDSIAKEREPAG